MAIDENLQGIDEQELGERAEAADRYGQEDPSLFIDYAEDCIKISEDTNREVRYLWDQCLNAYKAKIDYSEKESWQAQIITGDMNATVKQGMAVIRKALRQPDWYSIEGQGQEDKKWAVFFREALDFWLNPQHARFNACFSRASELAFAIGQSHEIIPMWVPGRGLVFTLVPPWQIFRDPDATPQDPWSGDFWVHVEWLDLWKVKALGNGNSRYVRLDEVTTNEGSWGQETPEKRARRKGQYYQRSSFRHAVKVIEHWGVILDKHGELLLDNARFTVAGHVLIRNPEPNPFVTLKWPGVSFSPLPDLFSFEGHGVIETSRLLWLNTCNLISMHLDDLSWRVNKLREVDRFDLEDPTDTAMHPGKTVFRARDAKTPPGQSVLKEVYSTQSTNETLGTLQHLDQRRENSSFVNQFVAGQRGTRTQITRGEVEIKTGQSMTIFDSIGEDIEDGAVHNLRAALEILILNWSEMSNPTVRRVMQDNLTAKEFSEMTPKARRELLRANCDIKIMGISAQIKNSELIPRYQALLKQAESQVLSKYFKPYQLLKHEVNSFGFYEPDFIVTDDEAEMIDNPPQPEVPPEMPGMLPGTPGIEGGFPPGGAMPSEQSAVLPPGVIAQEGGMGPQV